MYLGWSWTALEAHLICCDPLVVALSNNLKSKKYYLSKFRSSNSGKCGKMTHAYSTICFQIKITPRRRRQRCRLIISKRQIKGRGFQKCNRNFFWHTGMCLNCLPKRHFETFRTEEVRKMQSWKMSEIECWKMS